MGCEIGRSAPPRSSSGRARDGSAWPAAAQEAHRAERCPSRPVRTARSAPSITTLFPLVPVAVAELESLFFRRQEVPLVAAEVVVVDRVPVVDEVVVRAARLT